MGAARVGCNLSSVSGSYLVIALIFYCETLVSESSKSYTIVLIGAGVGVVLVGVGVVVLKILKSKSDVAA